jgi:hypothetical protein
VNLVVGVVAAVIVFSSVLVSNQIFVDQATVNRLDRDLAQAINNRLEALPGYEDVSSVAVVGRFYAYPNSVKTMQGDLNISGFMVAPHKLLSFTSGRSVAPASQEEQERANLECESVGVYPDVSSVFIIEGLAIVCLVR